MPAPSGSRPAKKTPAARFKSLNALAAKTGYSAHSEYEVESMRRSMAKGMKDARSGKDSSKGYSHQFAAAYNFGKQKATESRARVKQRRDARGRFA